MWGGADFKSAAGRRPTINPSVLPSCSAGPVNATLLALRDRP
jgi:hypothetical protein